MSSQDRSPDPNEPAAPAPAEIAVRVNPQPAPEEPQITLHESDLLEHLSSPEVQERMERVRRKLKESRQQEAGEAAKGDSDEESVFIVSDASVEEDGEGLLTMPDPDALLDMDIEGFDRDGLHQAPEAAFDAAQEEIEAGQKRERRDSLADTVFRLIELDEQGNETEGRELTLPEVAGELGMTVEDCEREILEALEQGRDADTEFQAEQQSGAEAFDDYWESRSDDD